MRSGLPDGSSVSPREPSSHGIRERPWPVLPGRVGRREVIDDHRGVRPGQPAAAQALAGAHASRCDPTAGGRTISMDGFVDREVG